MAQRIQKTSPMLLKVLITSQTVHQNAHQVEPIRLAQITGSRVQLKTIPLTEQAIEQNNGIRLKTIERMAVNVIAILF